MSTMNSEVYSALIKASASEEKAKAAAVFVTDYEKDINEVKPDLKVIKWGYRFNYSSRSIATNEKLFCLKTELEGGAKSLVLDVNDKGK